MATQSALAITAVGKPMTVITRPVPVPKGKEVLVKVTVVGMMPLFQKMRDYGLFVADHLPSIPGFDVAGIVISCGPDVTKYKAGDEVFGQGNMMAGPDAGGLQQYSILEEGTMTFLPENISADAASTLLCNLLASLFAIIHPKMGLGIPMPGGLGGHDKSFDYAGTTLVIIGGGSDTGKLAIQFAANAKIGSIITVASAKSTDTLKALGATHVVERHQSISEIKAQVSAITGLEGVLFVFDAVTSDHTLAVALLSSTERGRVSGLLPPAQIDESLIGEKKAGYDYVFATGSAHMNFEPMGRRFFETLKSKIEEGVYKPLPFKVIEGGLNADAVNKVLDEFRDGKYPGRWNVHCNA